MAAAALPSSMFQPVGPRRAVDGVELWFIDGNHDDSAVSWLIGSLSSRESCQAGRAAC